MHESLSFQESQDSSESFSPTREDDEVQVAKSSREEYDDEELIDDIIVAFHPRTKRVRDRRRVPIPRVLRRDLRRQLSFMFANVVNGHDGVFIAQFMARFMTPVVRMEKNGIAPAGFMVPAGTNCSLCNFSGVCKIVDYWSVMSDLVPDQVMQVEDCSASSTRLALRGASRSDVQTRSSVRIGPVGNIGVNCYCH